MITICLFVEVCCRPQLNDNAAPPSVESKNINTDNKPDQLQKIAEKTTDILEKIAEVNKKHGLDNKTQKSVSPQKPTLGLPRSQNQHNLHFLNSKPEETARSEFRFPTSPFQNPILEFLEQEKVGNQNSNQYPSVYEITNRQSQDLTPAQGFQITSTDHNAQITPEDIIPGQLIKRKIVHQQTVLVPNPNYAMQTPMGYQYPFQYPVAPNNPGVYKQSPEGTPADTKYLNNLEKQTISNIRNIISTSQNQGYPSYYNTFLPIDNTPNQNKLYGYTFPNKPEQEQQSPLGQVSNNDNSYNIYIPYPTVNPETSRQNWNWPGANYFPVHIKDPFLQMYNAITTMIEYGPNAGMQNPCNKGRNPATSKIKSDNIIREAKNSDEAKISVQVDGSRSSPQISINGDDRNGTYLDIEDIDIGATGDSSLKFTLNLRKEEREVKDDSDDIGTGIVVNFHLIFHKDLRPITVVKNQSIKPTRAPIISPPSRDPTHQTDEFGDESEEEKSEEVISNDNNKKLFSRDNTGSGVFIHRLKVRKGGVAIAGPGGIATAGSGGTAIVGPGGVAYTQPDSLAIAGSGTKVVAVDPTVNLGDLVKENGLANKTRFDPIFPPSRIGKVVAVGPVIYYNKGKD
ncbi:unnamed protein product [Diabrotica balteata]|uniref:DUF4774 domain-containing protein n=1 Tax=Diabrotica balteata TaxID=107213 RepID=A0A9N9SXQ2_DIABA|nr:unnamed protein product [Diabrotica balteata]